MPKKGDSPGSWKAKHDRIAPESARRLFAEVQRLAKKGDASPVKIARQLSASYSLSFSPGTIRHWLVGDRRPGFSFRNAFENRPSPALSYIIGANKGDGSILASSGIVKLEVTDKDSAQTFNANMASLFSRASPNRIHVRLRPDRLPMYVVKYASSQLARLLLQPLRRLLKLASVFPREFLRGFFDAEGHVDVGVSKYFKLRVGAENSDMKLLTKVRRLLGKLKVPSRIYRKRREGTVKTIRGESFVMRRTSYAVDIGRLSAVKIFAREIGFSIERKSQKLQDALLVIESCESGARPAVWKRSYSKIGGEWVRKSPV